MVAVGDGEGARVADVDAGVLPCVADGDPAVGAGSCGGACLASPRHADSVTSRTARQRIARAALKWVSPNRSAMMDEAPIDCCDCDRNRSRSVENIRHGHRCHLQSSRRTSVWVPSAKSLTDVWSGAQLHHHFS